MDHAGIYFAFGMYYKDIVQVLGVDHGITIGLRHLKRILKSRGLGRRQYDDVRDVSRVVYP